MTVGLLTWLLVLLLLLVPLLLLVVQGLILLVLLLQGLDLARGFCKNAPCAVQPVLHVLGEVLAAVLQRFKTRDLSARALSLQNAGTKALLVGELVGLKLLCIGRVGFRKYDNLLNHRFDFCLQLSVRILLPCLLLNLRRLLLRLWPLLLWLLLRLLLGLLLLRLHLLWILLCLYTALLRLSSLSVSLSSSLRRPLTLLRLLGLLGCGSTSRPTAPTQLGHDSGTRTHDLGLGLVTRLAPFGVGVVYCP